MNSDYQTDYQYIIIQPFDQAQTTNFNYNQLQTSCYEHHSNLAYSAESSTTSSMECPMSVNFNEHTSNNDNQYSPTWANSSSTPKSQIYNIYPETNKSNASDSHCFRNFFADSAYQTKLDFSLKSASKSDEQLLVEASMITEVNLDNQLHICVNTTCETQEEMSQNNGEKSSPSNEVMKLQRRKRPKILKYDQTFWDTEQNSPYLCKLCYVEFQSAAKFLMHQHRQHKNGSSLDCPLCGIFLNLILIKKNN